MVLNFLNLNFNEIIVIILLSAIILFLIFVSICITTKFKIFVKIKTLIPKYNIGDKVYFYNGYDIEKVEIAGIIIFENKISYVIDLFRTTIEENQLHDNPEELKRNLLENFKKGLDKIK